MQDRCNKTILTQLMQVAVILALSIPATAYTDNFRKSTAAYRGSHGSTSSYRGPSRSHGKHATRNSRANHSVAVKQRNTSRATSKQDNPGRSASGNRKSQVRSSESPGLNNSQGRHSSSGKERNLSQRGNVIRHKSAGKNRHGKRHGEAKQQNINNRLTLATKPKISGRTNSKQKNQARAKRSKSRLNRPQSTNNRLNYYRGKYVKTNPRKNYKHSVAIAQPKNNVGKKSAVAHAGHKQHNSHSSHKHFKSYKHNKHHKHHNHHKHSSRFIISPFVFFSFNSLYYPYGYYPYRFYSYHYHSRYYPYAYPVYRSYGYSPTPYKYEEPVYSINKPYGIDSPGWSHLAQGDFRAAINIFDQDIQSYPDAGIPKVGFALASAATGNMAIGVQAMREAFRVDPDSIQYLNIDGEVHTIIDDLIEAYEYELQQNNKSPDEAFMLSTLHYLKHDYGSAHNAINRAIRDGDQSPSMGKLHAMVDDQFSKNYAGNNN